MFKVNGFNPCVWLIQWYQSYVSPHKGFSCAHRVLTGGKSCSGYALEQFQTQKFLYAYRATRVRMRECETLYHEHVRTLPIEEQRAVKKHPLTCYLRFVNPQTYVLIAKGFLIHHWPKRNQHGGV